MGGKLPRPGYLHPRGASAQRQLHPRGPSCPGWGQDTPGYLHPRGASCPEAASPPGGKLPRVQDKPVHRHTAVSAFWVGALWRLGWACTFVQSDRGFHCVICGYLRVRDFLIRPTRFRSGCAYARSGLCLCWA